MTVYIKKNDVGKHKLHFKPCLIKKDLTCSYKSYNLFLVIYMLFGYTFSEREQTRDLVLVCSYILVLGKKGSENSKKKSE